VKSYPPKSTFSEYHIMAPKVCCAPKFLHALENDQVLLAQRGWGPPYNFFQRGVKNWLKIYHIHAYNFGGSESSTTILCHVKCFYVGLLTCVQLLDGSTPLRFWRAKNVQNLVEYRKTFVFGREYLWNA